MVNSWEIVEGNASNVLEYMPRQSVNTCVTSPPYWGLRDYQVKNQLGLEDTPEEYVKNMVQVFREVHRVLRDDGTLWLNLGDSYAMRSIRGGNKKFSGNVGSHSHYEESIKKGKRRIPDGLKQKDLVGIPWRVAFALQADGWYLRQDIIWHKPNPMPESVKDRCTKAHEYIFLLSKNKNYYYDYEAIKEDSVSKGSVHVHKKGNKAEKYKEAGLITRPNKTYITKAKRNKRSVWSICPAKYKEAHFAVFPEKLIEPCVLAGCPEGGKVLDPFCGSGTTLLVAKKHNRKSIGIELNSDYVQLAKKRLNNGE